MPSLEENNITRYKIFGIKVITNLDAKDLVPGDIILLEAGDVVPADCRLLSSFNLHIDESTLTGESTSVLKDANDILDVHTEMTDQTNIVFMGTNVVRGNCIAVVIKTGMKTFVGHISSLLEGADKRDTPLKQKMNDFGEQLGIIILVICGIIVALGSN